MANKKSNNSGKGRGKYKAQQKQHKEYRWEINADRLRWPAVCCLPLARVISVMFSFSPLFFFLFFFVFRPAITLSLRKCICCRSLQRAARKMTRYRHILSNASATQRLLLNKYQACNSEITIHIVYQTPTPIDGYIVRLGGSCQYIVYDIGLRLLYAMSV